MQTGPPRTTLYFRHSVLAKRPNLKLDWCLEVLDSPVFAAVQRDGRMRFWGYPEELGGKALRVVTLEDGYTIHNAFPDSSFPRRTV